MKNKLIIFICILLSGCISPIIFTPEVLPDAIQGCPYSVEIDISGGSGPVTASGFDVVIEPNILWLEVNEKKGNFYNSLILHGIPKISSIITVTIKGYMISTGWNSGTEFEKKYIIKVKDAE